MAEPIVRKQGITNLINAFIGKDAAQCIRENVCVNCGKPATEFTDPLSRADYRVTGMCQECQNKFYVEDDE